MCDTNPYFAKIFLQNTRKRLNLDNQKLSGRIYMILAQILINDKLMLVELPLNHFNIILTYD